eukprot:313884-Alexandrium_andersonii.AAC.1
MLSIDCSTAAALRPMSCAAWPRPATRQGPPRQHQDLSPAPHPLALRQGKAPPHVPRGGAAQESGSS